MTEGDNSYLYLPDLGEVDEVTIVEWLKTEGDDFSMGEDLVEVETEKTTFIVDAPAAGRIEQILLKPGERAHLGDRLAKLVTSR
jgi:pyruvate/2-oxoglutarate dehydrogenase complex dihydrolipoamide acyltransferase (E2) component